MPKIEFRSDGIGHFLSDNFLKVPLYQRSYAWEKENVEDLFEDIKHCFPEEYFIGTIVVTNKSDYLEIVDGQQRLATISLFFVAFRDFLEERGEEKKANVIENEFILKTSYRDEDKKQRLTLNQADNDFYLKRFIEKDKTSPLKASHKRLLAVYNFLKRYISNKYKSDGLDGILDLVDFIKNKLLIVVVVVSDDANAFVIFETLNDRGLILSQTDLIKNYLFNKATDRLNEAQDKWSRIVGAIEGNIGENEVLNYIRYCWSSKYGLTREKELYKNIKLKVKNKHQAITLLSDLEKTLEIYLALVNPNHTLWHNLPGCSEVIEELIELRLSQNRPLLISIVKNWLEEPQEVKKALKLILSWSVRNLIVGAIGSGSLEKEFSNLARLISEGKITNTEQLKSEAQKFIPTDKQFKEAFKIATVSKTYLARYYLRKIEQSYRTTPELKPIENPEKLTLEHILPINPIHLEKNWKNFDASLHKTYYRRIGNLTILDKKMNNKIANGPFKEKKKVYATSEINITKRLAEFEDWSPFTIEQRQNEFAEKAIEIWKI